MCISVLLLMDLSILAEKVKGSCIGGCNVDGEATYIGKGFISVPEHLLCIRKAPIQSLASPDRTGKDSDILKSTTCPKWESLDACYKVFQPLNGKIAYLSQLGCH